MCSFYFLGSCESIKNTNFHSPVLYQLYMIWKQKCHHRLIGCLLRSWRQHQNYAQHYKRLNTNVIQTKTSAQKGILILGKKPVVQTWFHNTARKTITSCIFQPEHPKNPCMKKNPTSKSNARLTQILVHKISVLS